jgi:hypothetical protein
MSASWKSYLKQVFYGQLYYGASQNYIIAVPIYVSVNGTPSTSLTFAVQFVFYRQDCQTSEKGEDKLVH